MDTPLIIFDWDGTLMDSIGRIVSSMRACATKLDLPVPSEQAVRDIIGLSLLPAIERLFGRLDAPQLAAFMQVYRQQYIYDDATPTALFPGATSVLQQLQQRGHQLAVATGKARHGLERVWQETASQQYFSFSRCADETAGKPHPQMLYELLAESGVARQQAVLVGDSIHDMQMAQRADMRAIGVSFGAHDRQQLLAAGAAIVIDDLSELLALV